MQSPDLSLPRSRSGARNAPLCPRGAATAAPDLLGAAAELLATARVAHLATADQYARPHVVPVVFVYDAPHLYTPLDGKAKRSKDPRALRRVQNIETNGRVSVVVDAWDEDWALLRWVRLEGTAEILIEGEERDRAAETLLLKYPQYQQLPLDGCPVIKVTVERITQWEGQSANE